MSSAAFVLLYIAHALRRQMAHAFADAGRRAPSGGRRWRGAATQGKKLSGHSCGDQRFARIPSLRQFLVQQHRDGGKVRGPRRGRVTNSLVLSCRRRKPQAPLPTRSAGLPASAKVWASLRPRCLRLPALSRRARASVTGLGKQAGHEVDECSHLGCRLPVLRIDDRYRPPGTLVPVFEHRAQQA